MSIQLSIIASAGSGPSGAIDAVDVLHLTCFAFVFHVSAPVPVPFLFSPLLFCSKRRYAGTAAAAKAASSSNTNTNTNTSSASGCSGDTSSTTERNKSGKVWRTNRAPQLCYLFLCCCPNLPGTLVCFCSTAGRGGMVYYAAALRCSSLRFIFFRGALPTACFQRLAWSLRAQSRQYFFFRAAQHC